MVQLTEAQFGDEMRVEFAWDGLSYTLINTATPRQRRNGTMQLQLRPGQTFVLTNPAACTTNVVTGSTAYFRDMSGRTGRVITGHRDIEIVRASAFLHFAQIVENKKIPQINQKLEMVAKTNRWSKFLFNEVEIFDIPQLYGKLVKVIPPYEIRSPYYDSFNDNQPTIFGVLIDPHFLRSMITEDSLLGVEWQSRIKPAAIWSSSPEGAIESFENSFENDVESCANLSLSRNRKAIVEKTSRIIPLSD
jgi:hypothetical protein